MKKCTKCEKVKPIEEFSRNRGGRQAKCKECAKAYQKAYYEANKEKILEQQKAYCEANKEEILARAKAYYDPEKNREWKLKRNFGIDLEQYDAMLEAQGDACAFCGKTQEENRKNLAVDHDHDTGEVRWLLCNNCNAGLGYFQDSPAMLRKVAGILEKWQNL